MNTLTKTKLAEVSNTYNFYNLSNNQTFFFFFFSARIIFHCLCAVYMYEIMILLNNFTSETTWPISTKFHVDPNVETEVRICSNGHAPLTVMPIYDKKIIIKNILLPNQELLKW